MARHQEVRAIFEEAHPEGDPKELRWDQHPSRTVHCLVYGTREGGTRLGGMECVGCPKAGTPGACVYGSRGTRLVGSSGKAPLQGGGVYRYVYMCGCCGESFSQRGPGEGLTIENRKAAWVKVREVRPRVAVPGGRRDEGDVVGPDHEVERVGDAVLRFHNLGPLSDKRKREPYVARMMRGAHLLAVCESSLAEPDRIHADAEAACLAGVHARVWHTAYYRRNTGIALYVAAGGMIPVSKVSVRETGDSKLQLMIADLEIGGSDFRLVVTHGEPRSDPREKIRFLERVRAAVGRVESEHPSKGRSALWFGDHNMVCDPARDELRGTPKGAQSLEVVRRFETVQSLLGVVDAYVACHPGLVSYTHKVRRIDRGYAPPGLLVLDRFPAVSEMRHMEREEVEFVKRAPKKGSELHRPDHKALEMRLRFTGESRGKRPWQYCKGTYTPAVWAKAKAIIRSELRV